VRVPPKNGKRPEWLNNITSIFGYDQNIPLQSCFVDVALTTAADDLNPFTPGAFDLVSLRSVTFPAGGTITYVYSGGNDGITCAGGRTATLTRTS
jgi:hypothetical protein